MASAGDTLGMFLLNLPRFHDRTQLMYPKLTPPEFRVEQIEKNRMHVSYISKRPGLQEFVRGLLQGLGKLFQESTAIQLIKSREVGDEYEIFEVSW